MRLSGKDIPAGAPLPELLEVARGGTGGAILLSIGCQQRGVYVELSERDSGAVLAFIVGALVFGAFAPRKTAGFAAPSLRALAAALAGKPAL